jgi:hypothetical protein
MDLALALALRVGLLVYCLVIPGWALLRAAGFASVGKLDRLIACLAAGAAVTSLTVTTLLLVGIYYRPLLVLILLTPAAYLFWSRHSVRAIERSAVVPPTDRPFDPIDRAVIVAALGFLAVYLVDAWTSPITWWDGLASWGKWAADWGRRTSSAHYVVGGYPQLVPRLVSVMYKLTAAHSDVLPLDFFALHGVYVLFALWFLLAAIRLAALIEMPAWPIVLTCLGSIQFREHSAAGTVDVLVCALVTTLIALYLGLRRGTWQARHETAVLGAAAAALLFTKWTGGIGLVLLVLIDRAARRAFPIAPAREARLSRQVLRAVAIAFLAMVPFLIEQGASEARIGQWQSDPFEVNISVRQMPTLLSTDANVVYRGGDTKVQAGLIQLRFWNNYDVPASLRTAFTAFLLLCVAASATTWFGRAVLLPLLAYLVVWLFWSSYDQRNIFVILPVLGLVASFGAARLWTLLPPLIWRNGVAVMGGLFLVLAGGGLMKDAQARIASLTRDRPLATRLHAMRGTTAEKVAVFYPHLDHDYRFMAALAQRTNAPHVLVTSPLFRFFDRGAHALSLWPYERVQSGDVFAGHEWHAPPADPRWVLVARGTTHRIWVRVPEMSDVAARVETSGAEGLHRVAHGVDRAELGEDGFIVWRATVRGDATATTALNAIEGVAVDQTLVSSACEPPVSGTDGFSCSGIVALTPEGLPTYREGSLAVGVMTAAAPERVTLSVARPLHVPGAPR